MHFERPDSDAHEPLDTTRKELASSYVRQSSLSMTETTVVLGFGDTRNFTRAYKRWEDVSPSVISGRGDRSVIHRKRPKGGS